MRLNFIKGSKIFGFSVRSGVDLPFENPGIIPALNRFNSPIYKATVGYGYGMNATFMQVLKAYTVFNNNGRIVTPILVKKLVSPMEQSFSWAACWGTSDSCCSGQAYAKVLIKVVQQGTGVGTKMQGLEVGKTGTAHIAEDGVYIKSYNGSFFGFVNDKKSK